MTAVRRSSQPDALPPSVALAFAPLHKRALGMAVGLATGLSIFLMTAIVLLRGTEADGINLWPLAAYFAGYSPSWPGALIGFGWGCVVGFVGGWFVAFCRNLVIAVSLFLIRTRSELNENRDFLDHI
ncbi:MAG: hypothetical protein ABI742_14095 [Gemmatimonadota bacterium]